ncbi:MAG: PHP domain-containing protein [Verrucomicrobiota bacterium]|nr:PHP domain-containing protein [Verrucomicrobiota bacterium]
MDKQFIDLHLHTSFSDGIFTPEQVANAASEMNLSAISLTDHDTIEGCSHLAEHCKKKGIEFISGTELSVDIEGNEMHLLGYFLDINNQRLIEETTQYQQNRINRIIELVAQLNKMGVDLQAEQVFNLAKCKAPGRPHLARALVKHGFCRSSNEAFSRFLRKGSPAWVPKTNANYRDAIELIHQAGGLAVMAHPGLNKIDNLIPNLVEAGLDGLECWHTRHPKSTTKRYREMATRLGLLVTGGSDCHGAEQGHPAIGTKQVPYDILEKMKQKLPTTVSSLN